MGAPGRRTSLGLGLNFGLLLLFLTIVLGFAVALGAGHTLDRAVLASFAFRDGQSSAALIESARAISWVGDAGQRAVVMVGFALWLLWDRQYRPSIAMLTIPPIAAATSSILKEAFGRERPDIVPHLGAVTDLSYPSGHAAGAAALLVTAALLIPGGQPRLRLGVALLLAASAGLSRIWLGVHWPSDVIGGWLWGIGAAFAGTSLAARFAPRR